MASISRGVKRQRKNCLGRMFHRRELCSCKKRGPKVGNTRKGKGTKWMVLADGNGTPLGAYLDAATPSEISLVEKTLDAVSVRKASSPGRPRKRPKRLIGDKGYDSNKLRKKLKRMGIEPIFPARSNHPNATDQDGRKLRRYRKRWIIERTFAWLGNFRRLVVRYERSVAIYSGFFSLACAISVLKRILQ